jgi:hypothetical protein
MSHCYNSELPIGPPGPQGPTGANGNTILNGIIAPSNSIGVNGDFYINTATEQIYGPKTAGVWGAPTSLVGTPGTNGDDGGIGPQGPQGPVGTTIPGGLIITDVLTSQTLGADLGVDITMPFSIIQNSGNGVTFEIDIFAVTSGATTFEILDVTGAPVTKLSPITLPTADTQYKFHIKLFMVKVSTNLRVSTSILGRELNDGGSYIDTDVNVISAFGITDAIYRLKFNDASSSNTCSLVISKLFNPVI